MVKFKQEHPVDVDLRPKALNRPSFNYPLKARQHKIQGLMVVCAHIDEQGDVTECIAFLPLGYGLEDEAVKAVKKTKFSPAMKNNQPIAYWMMLTALF